MLTGYRPDLTNVDATPRYLDLIEKGWSQIVSSRPSAAGYYYYNTYTT